MKKWRSLNWVSSLQFSWTVASRSIPFLIPNSLCLKNRSQDNLSTVTFPKDFVIVFTLAYFLMCVLVHLQKPLVRLTIPDANCTTFDWLSGSRLAVGLDTGKMPFSYVCKENHF